MVNLKKSSLRILVVFLLLCVVFIVNFCNVYADGSGAWIPSDSGSGGSGGGGGGGSVNCSGTDGKYKVECTGVSWIYYEYVGGSSYEGRSVDFVPKFDTKTSREVSGDCAREGGGFWHFGRNAQGFSYDGYTSYDYLKGTSSGTYVYLGSAGKWGHMATYNMKYWNDHSSWISYKTYASLFDQIYAKIGGSYRLMYKATKYATNPKTDSNSEVLKDYREAYKRKNGVYPSNGIPDSAYAFCSWSAPDRTLTLEAIDTSGTTLNASMDSSTVSEGENATVTAKDISGYTYLGIKDGKSGDYAVNSPTKSRSIKMGDSNKTVYAIYRRNTFEAKMEVTDNNANSSNTKKVTTIDWTSENNNSTEKYIKCASTCSVNFKHYLRQKEGTGGANKYKISTRLNSNSISYIGGNTFKEITPGTDGISLRDQNTTLNLGDIYYEKLDFYKHKEADARSLTVTVKAPYNFENTVSINTTDNIVYAGETASIGTTITIGDRQNDTVGESYATSVPGAKTKLYVNYDNGESYTIEENLGTISTANNGSRGQSINIKDLPAGTKLTAKFCLYPKNSISDTNTTTNFGNDNDINNWACSDEKEFTIAKRPSFQIWGGGLYSAGEVKTTPAIKNNLAGVDGYPYSAQGNGNKLAFGSWTELNIVGDKTITGLASGTGIFGEGEDYCKRVPLSFANKDCKSNITGGLNMNSTSSNVSSDKSALISRFDDPNSDDYILKEHTGDYSIDGIYNFSTEKITGDDGTIIREAPTMVIVVDGTLTINGNITYGSDGYTNLEAVPKIILYAKNIIISCNVTRVDAVLIAEQNINTCNNDDVNSSDRSNQLIINGSIISNTLTLNRTYGAATGNNSIIPAEIINYDSSIYLWAYDTSSAKKTGKIVTTYQQELPPRY